MDGIRLGIEKMKGEKKYPDTKGYSLIEHAGVAECQCIQERIRRVRGREGWYPLLESKVTTKRGRVETWGNRIGELDDKGKCLKINLPASSFSDVMVISYFGYGNQMIAPGERLRVYAKGLIPNQKVESILTGLADDFLSVEKDLSRQARYAQPLTSGIAANERK